MIANALDDDAAESTDLDSGWQRRSGRDQRTPTPPLEPKHRSACFEKALFETLPISELPPAQMRLKLPELDDKDKRGQVVHKHLIKPDGGSPTTWKLCSKFKYGSKNYDTALKLGRIIGKLEDPVQLEIFEWNIKQRVTPPVFDNPNRGKRFNRLNIQNMRRVPALKALTERCEIKREHMHEVQGRMLTARDALDAEARRKVAAKQAKIQALMSARANQQGLHRVMVGTMLMAFATRNHSLGALLERSRANREWEATRLWAAIILQRQMRKFVKWRTKEREMNAAQIIVRYMQRWRIRKRLRNRRQAAAAIIGFLVQQKNSQDASSKISNLIAAVRKAQKLVRMHQQMWKARTKIHNVQWAQMEPGLLAELATMRNGGEVPAAADISELESEEIVPGIPRRIPRHVRAAVLARYVAKAREDQVEKCKDYNHAKAFFVKFKLKEAKDEMEAAREEGSVPFNMGLWKYVHEYRKDLWEKRPTQPLYKYKLQERDFEKLILDAIELYYDEKNGKTTAEMYAAGVFDFVYKDPEQAPGRGNTPERAMPQPDMAAATQKIKKSTNAGKEVEAAQAKAGGASTLWQAMATLPEHDAAAGFAENP